MRPVSAFKRYQKGLSLIELMIALVLGLLISSAVIQVFIRTSASYQLQDELSYIQENGRYALSEITKDLRMVGYSSCGGGAKIANSVDDDSVRFQLGLVGYSVDSTDSTVAAGAIAVSDYPSELNVAWDGTDALQVYKSDPNSSLHVTSHNPNSATIHIQGTHPIKPGTVLLMASANCDQIGVFAMSGPTNSSSNANHFVHNTGSGSLKNCTKNLRGNFTCFSGVSEKNPGYGAGSKVMTVDSALYYVRNSGTDTTIPGLYRKELNSINAEELVQGVEDINISYGLDTDNDAVANQYLTARNIQENNWGNVTSVRVALVMRSRDLVDGAYVRKTMTATVMLRNRGGF